MAGLFGLAMGRRDTMVHDARSQLGLPLAWAALPADLVYFRKAACRHGGILELRCRPTTERTALPQEGTGK